MLKSMKKRVFILVMLMVLWGMALEPRALHAQTTTETFDDVPLKVNRIVVTGFRLHQERIYKDLDRKYRKKRLTPKEIDKLVEELLVFYRQEGYERLVTVKHRLRKGVLTIHVSLSRE